MREIPACGENRSLEGLSWPGEKAEAMRLREKEDAVSETARLHAHEWISQKTYKKQNRRSASITAGSCDVKKVIKGFAQRKFVTEAMIGGIIAFAVFAAA